MRATCPTCETAYTIPDDRIGAGREVRCARCATKWLVRPADPPAPVPAMPEAADDPFPSAADVLARAQAETRDDKAVAERPEPAAPVAVASPVPSGGGTARPEAVRPPAPAPVDIETLAKPKVRVAARPRLNLAIPVRKYLWRLRGLAFRARLPIGLTIFLIALALPVAGILLRKPLVRHMPQLASLYARVGLPVNLRGLDFAGIKTLRELENGQPVLVVEGGITNVTMTALAVPTVRLALRGPDGQEIYAWSLDPKTATVPAGDTVRFRSRLASPPDDAVDVQLRFTDRRIRQASHP